ncbi:transposase-like protein [Paenibacillus sp. RC73]
MGKIKKTYSQEFKLEIVKCTWKREKPPINHPKI